MYCGSDGMFYYTIWCNVRYLGYFKVHIIYSEDVPILIAWKSLMQTIATPALLKQQCLRISGTRWFIVDQKLSSYRQPARQSTHRYTSSDYIQDDQPTRGGGYVCRSPRLRRPAWNCHTYVVDASMSQSSNNLHSLIETNLNPLTLAQVGIRNSYALFRSSTPFPYTPRCREKERDRERRRMSIQNGLMVLTRHSCLSVTFGTTMPLEFTPHTLQSLVYPVQTCPLILGKPKDPFMGRLQQNHYFVAWFQHWWGSEQVCSSFHYFPSSNDVNKYKMH